MSKGNFNHKYYPNTGFKKGHKVFGGIKTRFKKGQESPKGMLGKKQSKEWKEKAKERMKGNTHVKKGQHNSPKTEFSKGQIPHNYKGGISKTKQYKNFYKNQYKVSKKSATGKHTKQEWENLKKFYNFMCLCCKKAEPEIKLTEDHIIPLSKQGSNFIENIQPLCRSCNSIKNIKIIKYAI